MTSRFLSTFFVAIVVCCFLEIVQPKKYVVSRTFFKNRAQNDTIDEPDDQDLCHSTSIGDVDDRSINCSQKQRRYFFDKSDRICRSQMVCVFNNSIEDQVGAGYLTLKQCLDNCVMLGRAKSPRCRPRPRQRPPANCQWVRATVRKGCPNFQLQCTGGVCGSNPCRNPCEICTYNLHYSVAKNCSSVNNTGDECPSPFKCERDIHCETMAVGRDDQPTTAGVTWPLMSTSTSKQRPTSKRQGSTGLLMNTIHFNSTKRQTGTTSFPGITTSKVDLCTQPVSTQPCGSGVLITWYYDDRSKTCLPAAIGHCGAFQTENQCLQKCKQKSDSDCPVPVKTPTAPTCRQEEKLLANGCLTLVLVCAEKSGRCPMASGQLNRICIQECSHDYDCPGNMKCCFASNNCTSLCITPAPVPSTSAPAPASITQTEADPLAQTQFRTKNNESQTPVTDSQTQAEHRASPSVSWQPLERPSTKSETLSATVTPIKISIREGKAGRCPSNMRRPTSKQCKRTCNDDADCLGGKRCCETTECGKICTSTVELRPIANYKEPHPCSGQPCSTDEICIPLYISATNPTAPSYRCEPADQSKYDPCVRNVCADGEKCVYEPKMCYTSPCAQFRCVAVTRKPLLTPGVKRRAEVLASETDSEDICASNPCRPCQKCLLNNTCLASENCTKYYCEDNCPGECEQCQANGRCVVVRQSFVCRTGLANDPCKNVTCEAFPEATCRSDPCNCTKPQFLHNGEKLNEEECH